MDPGIASAGRATAAALAGTGAAASRDGTSGALVVAFGNPLRGDDGVGPYAAASLPAGCVPGGTRVLIRHQLAPELAADIAAVDRVVFIDARLADLAGRVHVRRVHEDGTPSSAFTHHVEPGRLLHLARLLFGVAPRDCWLVTVGGDTFAHGEGLSPPVSAAVPVVHRLVRRLLRAG